MSVVDLDGKTIGAVGNVKDAHELLRVEPYVCGAQEGEVRAFVRMSRTHQVTPMYYVVTNMCGGKMQPEAAKKTLDEGRLSELQEKIAKKAVSCLFQNVERLTKANYLHCAFRVDMFHSRVVDSNGRVSQDKVYVNEMELLPNASLFLSEAFGEKPFFRELGKNVATRLEYTFRKGTL